jgi:hypothetical protein
MRDALEIMKQMNVAITQVRASGGGARSRFWRQLQADIYQQPIVLTNATEGPAYGVALLAGVGTGVWKSVEEACKSSIKQTQKVSPNKKAAAVYEKHYPRVRQAVRRLEGTVWRDGGALGVSLRGLGVSPELLPSSIESAQKNSENAKDAKKKSRVFSLGVLGVLCALGVFPRTFGKLGRDAQATERYVIVPIHVFATGIAAPDAFPVVAMILPLISAATGVFSAIGNDVSFRQVFVAGLYSVTSLCGTPLVPPLALPPMVMIRPLRMKMDELKCDLATGMLAFFVHASVTGS